MQNLDLVAQGAEAKIYLSENVVIKLRISKAYRLVEIDRMLIKKRTRAEKRILKRLWDAGVCVPRMLEGALFPAESAIYMEKIDGTLLRDIEIHKELAIELGKTVRCLHDLNVIHGDLTTSNFVLSGDKIFVIDFGLSFLSGKDEDKAVDLYVFERAARCIHGENILEWFYHGYGASSVMKRLADVRRRGRKREESAIG
eukprot:jgi/Antlo1/1293/1859